MNSKRKPDKSICQEADEIVGGQRRCDYGPPTANFLTTANAFNALTGHKLTPQDVAIFMIVLKLARQVHTPKRDNLVDICGYAKCLDLINQDALTAPKSK